MVYVCYLRVPKDHFDGDKLCPQAFSWLDWNGFPIEIGKKKAKNGTRTNLQIWGTKKGSNSKPQIFLRST